MAQFHAYENIGGGTDWYEFDKTIEAGNAGDALDKAAAKWLEDNQNEALEQVVRTRIRVTKASDTTTRSLTVSPGAEA